MSLAAMEADALLSLKAAAAAKRQELESCCVEFAQRLQLPCYDFTLFPPVLAAPRPDPLQLTNFPSAWCELYVAEQFARIDPHARQAREGLAPLFWDQLEQPSPEEEQRFVALAAAHGLRHGVTLALTSESGETSIFTLAGPQEISASSVDRMVLTTRMRSFAAVLHEVASRLVGPQTTIVLSEREKDCLTLTAAGLDTNAIAKRLSISGRTVLFHLYEASHKMGVHGRHRTLRRAVQVRTLNVHLHAMLRGFDDLFDLKAPNSAGLGTDLIAVSRSHPGKRRATA